MKKTLILLLILVSIAFISAEDWKLKIERNQIQVYTREVPGSDFNEFKGVVIINSSIDVLIALLRDIPNQINWLSNCKESRIIKILNDDTYIIYTVTKTTWPLKDRDCIWKREYINKLENGEYFIKFSDISLKDIPESNQYIRMTDASGYFKFKIIGADLTEVTYTFKGNPGGKISANISNAASINFPYQTLENMKEIVKNTKYIELAKKYPYRKMIDNFLTIKESQ